ncbi:unnamed protein product [Cochlearia groenlandica]
MNPTASLDSWREFFRRRDSDIFTIIDHAIMVASTDCPIKFKSRRDKIAELLFSCRVSRCVGCDHLELSVPGDADIRRGEDDGAAAVDGKESNCSYDEEAEALSDAIEECSLVSKEVYRIKELLLNKEDQANSVLYESLRKLQLMSLNVEILKSTEIGKAVNGLRKHGSDNIRQLAKTLIAEWKELVDQWVNTTKDITGDEGTPESVNPSVLDEEEAFPSLPYDVDIFTPEPNGFEISHFFDSLDFDGNPREYNTSREHERKQQNIAKRKPEGTQMRIQDAPFRSIKPSSGIDFDATRRRSLKKNTNETVSNHKPERPMIQRRPLVTEHKRKAPGFQQEKHQGPDADAKFEFTQRKLQERYQQHETAKKQRTVQVLEIVPKQGNAQKPQLKRPGLNNKKWGNGRK